MLKYKITQIMDDLSKPECVIYGEYRDSIKNELFSISIDYLVLIRFNNNLWC